MHWEINNSQLWPEGTFFTKKSPGLNTKPNKRKWQLMSFTTQGSLRSKRSLKIRNGNALELLPRALRFATN